MFAIAYLKFVVLDFISINLYVLVKNVFLWNVNHQFNIIMRWLVDVRINVLVIEIVDKDFNIIMINVNVNVTGVELNNVLVKNNFRWEDADALDYNQKVVNKGDQDQFRKRIRIRIKIKRNSNRNRNRNRIKI